MELVTWLELDLQTFIKDLEIISMLGSDLAFIWALDMKSDNVITNCLCYKQLPENINVNAILNRRVQQIFL